MRIIKEMMYIKFREIDINRSNLEKNEYSISNEKCLLLDFALLIKLYLRQVFVCNYLIKKNLFDIDFLKFFINLNYINCKIKIIQLLQSLISRENRIPIHTRKVEWKLFLRRFFPGFIFYKRNRFSPE